MEATKQIETIVTGLTANYVGYWTPVQAIKEAAQNICYGAIKSGERPVLSYDPAAGMGMMEDSYTGFEKRHLYLGESEQRNDPNGLGNFGEGWKMFLLIMAREKRFHQVDTVGFTFFGEMVSTDHGVDVLHIRVTPNNRTKGTIVIFSCQNEEFERATDSFAYFQGISMEHINDDSIIPRRSGELWVNGVRIEQDGNMNPLNLHYSYNVRNRQLINRDRSQVNIGTAMREIRILAYKSADLAFAKEFVNEAINGNTCEDIVKGPAEGGDSNRRVWMDAISEAHNGAADNKMVILDKPELEKEARYRGYTPLRLPSTWNFELRYTFGYKNASEVVSLRPEYKEMLMDSEQERMLQKAKMDAKKALNLASIKYFPEIQVVETLTDENRAYEGLGNYSHQDKVIRIARAAFRNQERLTSCLIHELVHWKTGAGDFDTAFISGWEEIVLNLLGYKARWTE